MPITPDAEKGQFWDRCRAAIVHEDSLVNHRITWLLSTQAFLVAGFFAAQAAVLAYKPAPGAVAGIEFLLAWVLLGAAWVCYITGSTIAAAYRQLSLIREAWLRAYGREAGHPEEPMPAWLLTDPRAADTTSVARAGQPAPATGDPPEYPPISGKFRYSFVCGTARIPFVLLAMDIPLVLVCLVTGAAALGGWDAGRITPPHQDATPQQSTLPSSAPPPAASKPRGCQSPRAAQLAAVYPKLWYNKYFGNKIEDEVATAAREGVAPVVITDPPSLAPIASGGRLFKWVLTVDCCLLGLPRVEPGDVIKHSVATKGGPVRAAGMGRLKDGVTVVIDRHSGHYRPDADSLVLARAAFEDAGFTVEIAPDGIER